MAIIEQGLKGKKVWKEGEGDDDLVKGLKETEFKKESLVSNERSVDVITGLSINLDVDGDTKVTAFGDGLMVIRKLFGSAFTGDALTAKAISANATRSSTEVYEYIKCGVDDLSLDVDGDGKVTAFGDGLMVIRKLFGSAFAGEALTAKAISADATRDTDEIHEYIAAMTTIDPIG